MFPFLQHSGGQTASRTANEWKSLCQQRETLLFSSYNNKKEKTLCLLLSPAVCLQLVDPLISVSSSDLSFFTSSLHHRRPPVQSHARQQRGTLKRRLPFLFRDGKNQNCDFLSLSSRCHYIAPPVRRLNQQQTDPSARLALYFGILQTKSHQTGFLSVICRLEGGRGRKTPL